MKWKLQLQTGASEKVTCAYTQEGGEGEGHVMLKERFQSSSQPKGELGKVVQGPHSRILRISAFTPGQWQPWGLTDIFVGITLAAVLRIGLSEGGDKEGNRETSPDGTAIIPVRDGRQASGTAVTALRSKQILSLF